MNVSSVIFAIELAVLLIGMVTLGVLILRRRPGNVIGWLFCAVPAGILTSTAGGTYNEHGHPGGTVTGWVASWAWITALLAYALFVPLLFPDGNLMPGRRWRIVARVEAVVLAGAALGIATGVDLIAAPFVVGCVLLVLVSIASMVVRYRRAQATERLQVRWCALAAIASIVGFVAAALISSVTSNAQFLFVAVYAIMPAAMAIAILRYRLYEIDVIIRRTITYACLVAALAAVYLAGVTGIGALLQNISGSSGTLAVTVSTLAVAAAFQPLRRAIRTRVDHRFYRRAYDAQLAADGFSGKLREEIDLDALTRELLAVVGSTVQPATASVWLRRPAP